MQALLAGNICSVLAMITDAVSTSRKSAKAMLLFQTGSQLFYVVGAIVLKGYSAAVQNAVSILRNLLAIWGKQPKWVEWLLVASAVVLGIAFNNRGFIGWLPVIASLEYSVAVFRFRLDKGVVCIHTDKLLVVTDTKGCARAKVKHRLSAVGFALCVFTEKDVEPVGKLKSFVLVISKILKE